MLQVKKIRGEAGLARAECGQTIILVAMSIVALVGMAALAVDVTMLYIARSQAEKGAAAGALAGAKAFETSGFTSGRLGAPSSGTAQSVVCNNSTGLADIQAKAAAMQNLIAGKTPTSVTTACSLGTPLNPRITVTVRATGLPTFFSRIWGNTNNQVTAVANAEAYNPSGQTVPIQVASVKPWLVANCDYNHHDPAFRNPNCPLTIPGGLDADFFVDPNNNYAITNNGSFIGEQIKLQQVLPEIPPVAIALANSYLAVNLHTGLGPGSISCPATSAVSCGEINSAGPDYPETIACANSRAVKCGDQVEVELGGGILLSPSAKNAPKCLIHSAADGLGQGQDIFTPVPGDPISIEGGSNNPDVNLQSKVNISRSDSVVTVPLWDGAVPALGLTLAPPRVIGFMQLGITNTGPGLLPILTSSMDAVILNVSGCGTATGTPVSGGKSSPIPVRLVQQ